jgi:protein-disulfide isomerase
MENRLMNDEQWVNERLRVLGPERNWHPNAGAALAGLQRRDRRRRTWQRGWIWSAAMTSACAAVLLALPAPAKCALAGVACPRPGGVPVLPAPAQLLNQAVNSAANYKASGAADAPVVVEIYSDYECPACAAFYTTVFPRFVDAYVKTGKVRVVHRDFPLPQHPFARLAARYANAAGELGHYDEVVTRLFASQPEWATNGNVDATVAQVLPAETMRSVRALVQSSPQLDATVASDLAIVARDRIDQTPTIVFVYRGMRRKVAGPPSFELLRIYLDEALAQ